MKTDMGLLPKLAVMAGLILGFSAQARTEELVVDLSRTVVPITTNFTGSDLLLFGSFNNDNNTDIVVVVRGPFGDEVVRRKKRIMGVWANGAEMIFEDVPSYYYIAANRPIEEFLTDELSKTHKIGISGLDLTPKNPNQPSALVEEFRAGLIRTKQDEGLFGSKPGNVYFKGSTLFRTKLHFPANVPVGEYGVDVFVIRDNKIIADHTTILSVQKFGIEASIYDFAHKNALSYGIIAIILATAAGWLASVLFRKS